MTYCSLTQRLWPQIKQQFYENCKIRIFNIIIDLLGEYRQRNYSANTSKFINVPSMTLNLIFLGITISPWLTLWRIIWCPGGLKPSSTTMKLILRLVVIYGIFMTYYKKIHELVFFLQRGLSTSEIISSLVPSSNESKHFFLL